MRKGLIFAGIAAVMVAVLAAGASGVSRTGSNASARVAPPLAKPKITEVKGKCLTFTGELDVIGARFGEEQGSREVVLNGAPRDVLFWQKSVVRVEHGYDFPAGQMVKVYLRDKGTGTVLSNVFEFFNLYCIYWNSPTEPVSPGTAYEIRVKPGMGAGAQGRVIVVGGQTAAVLSWTNDTVRFRVPALKPGEYNIHIKKAGELLSNEYPIMVK